MLLVAAATLLPWTVSLVRHPHLLVRGLGLPEPLSAARPLSGVGVVLMHPGGPAQPMIWVLAPLVLVGLVGLVRDRRGVVARSGFALFLIAIAGSLFISRQAGAVVGDPSVRYWTGATAAIAVLGLLAAALVAGDQARVALRRYAFGWRQAGAGILALALLAGTCVATVQLLVRGVDRPLTGNSAALLPVFAAAEVGRPTSPRLLLLDGPGPDGAEAVRYAVIRDPEGLRLGDADVAPTRASSADGRLTDAVRQAAAGEATALPMLAEFGVSMLVVRNSGADSLARLADLDGLERVPTAGAIVWRSQLATGELVVLGPKVARVAGDGGDLPANARPRALSAAPGASRAVVASGLAGRLLVLAEPASSHWRASLGGKRLPATTAYGWAQAWRLPASGGQLDVHRSGDGRAGWLWLQLAVVVAAAVLAIPVVRRRQDDDGPTPSEETT
jgi:hypothetical protein